MSELDAKQQQELRDAGGTDIQEYVRRRRPVYERGVEALTQILHPGQFKRLNQIGWQLAGPREWLTRAKEASLTPEQQEKVKAVRDDLKVVLSQSARVPRTPEALKKHKDESLKNARTAREKLLGLMTPEQKTEWKRATGEPFRGEEELFDVLRSEPKK